MRPKSRRRPRRIHAARYSRSKRLQRVVSLMSDGLKRSTWVIQQRARVCNAHTCISELRAQGFRFPAAKQRMVKGERRWYYQLSKGAA